MRRDVLLQVQLGASLLSNNALLEAQRHSFVGSSARELFGSTYIVAGSALATRLPALRQPVRLRHDIRYLTPRQLLALAPMPT